MIDRRYIRYFDWISFGLIVTLLCIGVLFVFSATSKENIPFSPFFKKQLFGAIGGIVIYFIFSIIELSALCRWGYFGYFGVLGLLLYTIIGGSIGMGGQRWINLHFVTFQPSELVKLFLPLSFAFYFVEEKQEMMPQRKSEKKATSQYSKFLFPLGLLGISFLLIKKQPDLGTALVILLSGLIILWVAKLPRTFFIVSALICFVSAPIIWKSLKPYQQKRVLVLLGYGDVRNERYQIEQSKIAIGSGGLIGKGLMKGTQNRLSFLPEARTDFIFSVVCEELGFLGAMFIILLFSLLFIRLTYIAFAIPKLLEQIVVIGLLSPIMISTLFNIGMVTGLLPIVGVPLPLFTYGITHLWITMASLGILNNISIRRFLYY
jgi:rod shape determining protein RodA